MKSQLPEYRKTRVRASRTLISLLFILILLSGCAGGSAPSLDSSAQAWVEYPYKGSILPMEQLTLVVYASDSSGINYIHIKINGQSLPDYAASPMTTDGSSRLVRIDYVWQPPSEGEYLVEAVGVSVTGASGQSSTTRFCIVTCEAEATSTSTPAPGATDTPTPAPDNLPIITLPPLTLTPTETLTPLSSSSDFSVDYFASPPYINGGSCTTLQWDVKGAQSVYLGQTNEPASGQETVCPCETSSYTLTINLPNGSIETRKVRVEVHGSCSAPITDTPTIEPPPSDTSGPTINAVYAVWESCNIYGQADISDPSGVSWAEFHYNLNNQGWAWIKMNESGGIWESQVGVSVSDGFNTPVGSLIYKVRTLDSLNNESWSGESTLNYTGCGGVQ